MPDRLMCAAEEEILAALLDSKKYLEQVLQSGASQEFDTCSVHILLSQVLEKLVSSIREQPQQVTDASGLTSLLQRALQLRVHEQGWHHPDVWQTLHHVATELELSGHHSRAADMLTHELALRIAAVGTHHPATILICQKLGKALLRTGRLPEAELILSQALNRAHSSEAVPRAVIASLLHLSGVSHGLRGRHDEVVSSLPLLLLTSNGISKRVHNRLLEQSFLTVTNMSSHQIRGHEQSVSDAFVLCAHALLSMPPRPSSKT
jgi:hypothetical protein